MRAPAKIRTEMGFLGAIWGSLLGSGLSYYPRQEESAKRIESKEMLEGIQKSLKGFDFDPAELTKASDPKLLLDRARDSLEETKKQTEYQDAKAGRLLTIVAFLTAAVGTVFGKFIDLYPLHNGLAPVSETSLWVSLTYLLFGIYLLLVAAGALVTFHAISTRFVWPPGGSNLADKNEIVSLLFFQQIVRTKPESWGKAFAGDKAELLRMYYKNYVTEAYLVATKVADKLRYLDPGQRLLIASIRVLFALFLLLIVTFVLVPPPPKTAATPAATGITGSVAGPAPASSPGIALAVPDRAASAIQQRPPTGAASAATLEAPMQTTSGKK
ncbi:hypothetical protein [Variovorax paradoxus]|uniref:hypothetical protein n=1 Tax=Variovorax paradoxus TaxID=34073 RepID=UPI003ECD9F3A